MPDTAATSDADLMRCTAEGSRHAFAELYRRHNAAVYRFARLMTGSNVVAEDVVQDVFLAVMGDASRWDPSRSSLTTYLYGAARHHTRRRMLLDRRFVTLGDCSTESFEPAAICDVPGDLIRRDEIEQLRRAILALPSRYREVIVMCDLQDVSYADAAAALHCALGTIRSRLHRARQLLTERVRRAESTAGTLPVPTVRCEA